MYEVRTSIRLPHELAARLDMASRITGITRTSIIKQGLEIRLSQIETQNNIDYSKSSASQQINPRSENNQSYASAQNSGETAPSTTQ